jgi:hypothetical protein
MAGITASALRNRAHRYNVDFVTAFNAPPPKVGHAHLQQIDMEKYLSMLAKWPEHPNRKPNGAAKPEPPPQSVSRIEPMETLFAPRQKAQEVDVRVTVVGDQDKNVVAIKDALERLCGLTLHILEELQELNGPPPSARHIAEIDPIPEDHTSNDMD